MIIEVKFYITTSHIVFRFRGANVLLYPDCLKLIVEVNVIVFNP
jgi:hypothetical protein